MPRELSAADLEDIIDTISGDCLLTELDGYYSRATAEKHVTALQDLLEAAQSDKDEDAEDDEDSEDSDDSEG